MRQLVFHGPRRLAVEEAEAPSPGPGEVTVAVPSVGVCGSDVHGYAGVNSRRVPSTGDAFAERFPIAIECAGHSATLAAALAAVPPKATVVFVGLAEETVELPATPLMVGERVIVGSSVYCAADFRDTAAWVASGETDLSPIIEERVDLDGLPAVFDGYADGSLHAAKTVLQPGA